MYWLIGVLIAVFIVFLWKNGEVEWGRMVSLGIGGLIGGLIGLVILVIKKAFKNNENERAN